MDETDLLGNLLAFLESRKVPYCVIGGQAVNAYVDPLVSLDLDIAVAVDDPRSLIEKLRGSFRVASHPHSINIEQPGSNLRAQIQTDPRYADFVHRAVPRDVLGIPLSVAGIEDVLQGKLWAAADPERRPSKRLKDLSDIARLLEAAPHLRTLVPDEILKRLT